MSRFPGRGRKRGAVSAVVCVLLVGATALPVQGAEEPAASPAVDPWETLRLLIGTWEGEIDGKLGTGRAVRHYEMAVRGRFLVARHLSVRLPQEKSPEGDEHEELAVFSFDRERETIVLREFMSEGVVVRSPCEVEPRRIVCVAEAVESGPGIRARLTLEIEDRYRFTEIYELAFPGRELELYFTNRWTRAPMPDPWR